MLVPLLVFLMGLMGMLGLVPVFGLLCRGSRRNGRVRLVIGAAVLAGYAGGGALVWSLTPAEWQMSFGETLTAAVDAKTYGHPTEHYAESILVVMMFACAAGALISGILAAAAARLWRPPQQAGRLAAGGS